MGKDEYFISSMLGGDEGIQPGVQLRSASAIYSDAGKPLASQRPARMTDEPR
jgi:hypothetical protein